MIFLYTKETDNHLKILDGLLYNLLHKKWHSFIKKRFYSELIFFTIFYILCSIALLLKREFHNKLVANDYASPFTVRDGNTSHETIFFTNLSDSCIYKAHLDFDSGYYVINNSLVKLFLKKFNNFFSQIAKSCDRDNSSSLCDSFCWNHNKRDL